MSTRILTSTEISLPLFGENFAIDVPNYISIFGFNIYLYALCITAGFCLAALYVIKRRDTVGLTKDNILDLVIIAVPVGLIGARIYYIIFNPGTYFGEGNWGNILKLREGGLAVYGGIIASGFAFIIYSKIKKIKIGKLLDAAAFGLLIGQSVGRWGNFFNREAHGIETGLPWRMGLMEGGVIRFYHPAFLYESLWNAVGLVLLHIYSKKRKSGYPGQYFLMYLAWYGFGRFFIEGIRTDSLYVYGTDIRVSQLIAALSFATAIALLVRNHIRGPGLGDAGGEPVIEEGGAENASGDIASEADAQGVDGDTAKTDGGSPSGDITKPGGKPQLERKQHSASSKQAETQQPARKKHTAAMEQTDSESGDGNEADNPE